MTMIRKLIHASLVLAAFVAVAGCGTDEDTPSPPTAGTSPAANAPAAPTNLRITGALPDLNQPVPPGQGELGRLSLQWQDNSDNEAGFRIYQDCGGEVSRLLEVPADNVTYGPLQSCRPGKLGIASFNADGVSAILWSS